MQNAFRGVVATLMLIEHSTHISETAAVSENGAGNVRIIEFDY
jgi:hypothetical protein